MFQEDYFCCSLENGLDESEYGSREIGYPYFTGEETGSERVNNIFKILQ